MSVRIIHGDCREVLRTLPDESVHCVVTSPPYWGLRDYGTAQWEGGDLECEHIGGIARTVSGGAGKQYTNVGSNRVYSGNCKCGARRVDVQIGLEASPDEYVTQMVDVFRDVRRVLRSDGTLWLNLGDTYASNWPCNRRNEVGSGSLPNGKREARPPRLSGLKDKDLCGIPWRVAFALQADGWWLRQEIIWAKDNPMPESVTDRCTKAHEQIFLLSKQSRYYFDQEAISEPCSPNTHARLSRDVQNQIGSERAHAGEKTNGTMKAAGRKSWKGSSFDGERDLTVHQNVGRNRGITPKTQPAGRGIKNNESFAAACSMPVERRNKRSVWNVSTQPFSEAHFATFPPALIEPCILAGCPKGGTILDPFGGAGTTGLVADRLGRNAILIELNPEYAAMASKRVAADCPMFAEVL